MQESICDKFIDGLARRVEPARDYVEGNPGNQNKGRRPQRSEIVAYSNWPAAEPAENALNVSCKLPALARL